MGGILSSCLQDLAATTETNVGTTTTTTTTTHIDENIDYKSLNLSQAIQYCWNLDSNRCKPNVDYVINVQKGKKPWWKEDKAPDPLFTRVSDSIWQKPTYKTFRLLLDNYHSQTGQAEVMTTQQRSEIMDFIRAISKTAPIRICHAYCHAHRPDLVANKDFEQVLYSIWFELYRRERGGPLDSSGFEHVFCGEVRDHKITGFHNWIQFYLQEKAGAVDYRGYLKPKSSGEAEADGNDHVLSLQFLWKGVEKEIGTMFIGSSPEFEIAIYTMCFLCGGEKNVVELHTGTDIFNMEIVCHKMMNGKHIGTTYPYVLSHYET